MGNGAGVRGIARVYPERIGCENQHSTCQTCPRKSVFRSFGEHPGSASAARSAVCSTALSGQAPKPHSGAPKARSLTAKARMERRSACCAACCHQTLFQRSSTRYTHSRRTRSPASAAVAVHLYGSYRRGHRLTASCPGTPTAEGGVRFAQPCYRGLMLQQPRERL